MPGVCVSCSGSPEQYKVLKCLHAICRPCIGRAVQHNGSLLCPRCKALTPSPGPGKTLLATLPCCRASSDASEASSDDRVLCIDCEDDVEATHRCRDCEDALCSTHRDRHPKVRRSRGHRVDEIEVHRDGNRPGERSRGVLETCPLHFEQALTSFCKECKDLCCQVCLETGAHQEHEGELQPVKEAAGMCRTSIAELCTSTTDNCNGRMMESVRSVQASIDAIKHQAEKASEEIAGAFQRKIELMKKRQDSLLKEVDYLCWQQLQPYEEQHVKLLEGMNELPHLSELSKQCVGDCDVLRLGPWIQLKAAEVCKVAEKGVQAPTCRIQVTGLESGVPEESINRMGLVLDGNAIDAAESSVEMPAEIYLGSSFTVKVNLKDRTGQVISDTRAFQALSISIENATSPQQAASTEADVSGHIVTKSSPSEWSVTISADGVYAIRVTCNSSTDIGGSHRRITVRARPLPSIIFDAAKCHTDLVLSNGNSKVFNPTKGPQKSVYTAAFSSGPHSLRLRFHDPKPEYGGEFPICGIVDSGYLPLEKNLDAKGTFVGYGSSRISNGKAVHVSTSGDESTAWEDGAVFELQLDCKARTFTLRCQQPTGVHSETTWKNIPRSVCFRAGLYYDNSSFEILP